jgi:hypothetical protein
MSQDLFRDLESLVKKHSALALEKKNTDSVLKSLQVIELSVKIVSSLKKLYVSDLSSDFLFDAIANSISGKIVRSDLWLAYMRLSTHYNTQPYQKSEFFRRLVQERKFILQKSGVDYLVPPRGSRTVCSAFSVETAVKNLLPHIKPSEQPQISVPQ